MITLSTLVNNLRQNTRGATVMEFGLVAGPLMMILLGIMDIGYRGYLDTLAKSKLHEIARQATTGGLSVAQIKTAVEDGLDPVLLSGANVDVEVVSYFDFTSVGKPEKITTDNDGDGALDSGDCYLDANGNDTFDVDFGTSGTGGPDDIVNYTITITSPRLFPLAKLIGGDETISVTNSTALRNQPFGAQNTIPEICEP